MIIQCAHCHARYQYDPAKFEGKPSKKIRCAKCQQVFEIFNPDMKTAGASRPAPPAPAAKPEPPKPTPQPPRVTTPPTQPAAPKPTPQPAPTTRTIPGIRPAPVRGEHMDMTMRGRPRTVEEAMPEPEAPPLPQPGPADGTLRMPAGRRISLAIIDGPDSGSVFRIEKPKVVIGRSGADLVLNDNEASRHHAALEIRDTVIVLQDLGSTNGTLVDGNRIEGQTEITNQSEFQVGSSTLMLIVTEDEAPPSR